MENEKSITEGIEKRDWKLTLQALFAWWKLCFLLIFTIAFIISIVFEGLDIFLRLLKCAIIAFIGAFPADALAYFVILPIFTRKSRKSGKRVTEIIQKGLTSENIAELEHLLEICSPYDTHGSTTIITTLAEHYILCGEFEKAERYLNEFNIYFYNSISNSISSQLVISIYFQLRIRLENQKNGRDAANAAYALAEPYFSKFYGKNEFLNCLIDSGTAEYDYANGRYNDAIQRILPYVEFTEVKCETYASLARYSMSAGKTEQAKEYLQLAEKNIKNATDKAQVEYLRSTLFG